MRTAVNDIIQSSRAVGSVARKLDVPNDDGIETDSLSNSEEES